MSSDITTVLLCVRFLAPSVSHLDLSANRLGLVGKQDDFPHRALPSPLFSVVK
jgi:hypothetical protein